MHRSTCYTYYNTCQQTSCYYTHSHHCKRSVELENGVGKSSGAVLVLQLWTVRVCGVHG